MKKIIVSLMLIGLLATNMFVVSGCLFDSDADIAKRNVEKLVAAMQNKDHAAVKALFASNKIADIEGFDDSVDELLNYFEGDYVSYSGGGPMTSGSMNYGAVEKYHNISCDITTTVRVYRLAVQWYVKDTTNSGNVGIWQIAILKMEDDPQPEYSYWGNIGDPSFLGIQIAVLPLIVEKE